MAIGGKAGARSATAWRGLPPASARSARSPATVSRCLSLNSDRYLELYLAAGWSGTVIVPLNIRWSPLENEDAMRDCRAGILFVDKAFAAVGATLASAIPGLKLVYADDGEAPAGMEGFDALIARSTPMQDAMRESGDLAGIFYTGGTTGRSKGVMLSHGNLMVNALNALGEGMWPSSTVYLHAAPMFHLANGAAMYSVLLSGGSNVIIQGFTPDGVAGGDPARSRYRRAAGADHDPDVRRSSQTRRLRPVVAEGHFLRRLRRSATPCSAAP